MEQAYRRPVTEQELASKLSLVALVRKEGDTFEEGVRLALQAILASPDFLFRIERDPKPAAVIAAAATPAAPAAHYVTTTNWPRACLTSSGPACRMRNCTALAKEQKLRQPAVLEAQVRRMLADPKSRNLVDNWAGTVAANAQSRPHQARSETLPDGRRRIARRDAERDQPLCGRNHSRRPQYSRLSSTRPSPM